MAESSQSSMLPSFVAPSAEAAAVQARRKQNTVARNALPKVFFAYDASSKSIVLAFVVSHAFTGVGATVVWTVSRVVFLQEPQVLSRSDYTYKSSVFKMTPATELRLRQCTTRVGGSLNSHFIEFAASSWKVWNFTKDLPDFERFEDSLTFNSQHAIAKMLGVIPSDGPCQEAIAALQEIEIDGADSSIPVHTPTGEATASSQVRERLTCLSTTMERGAVSHTFTGEAMLQFLQFSANLRPGASVSTSLSDAASILLGRNNPVVQELRTDTLAPLPSLNLMRMARVKLDMMSILFERRLFLRYRFVRYLLIDSSPQLGFNF